MLIVEKAVWGENDHVGCDPPYRDNHDTENGLYKTLN